MIDFKGAVARIRAVMFSKGRSKGLIIDEQRLENELREQDKKLRLYKRVYSTDEGKFVLLDLMREAGLLDFVTTHDSTELAVRTGRRHMAVYIAELLNFEFEHIVDSYMEIENLDRKA